jgi:all-trans-retinol dehydrogenase (NAD+)
MPIHNGWLPREGSTLHTSYQASLTSLGLTGDPIGRFIKKTALNPAFTLIFILLARYTKKGSDLSVLHETAFSRIKTLFYFGLARWASGYLDGKVLDNWTTDTYDWDKEIVLITGGAGGIGGNVVKLLAERGTKIVVLDVIPMTFEARMFWVLQYLQALC